MLVVLLGAAALAVDLGASYSKSAKIQNTCDAAALASAQNYLTTKPVSQQLKTMSKTTALIRNMPQLPLIDSSSRVEVASEK